jgi:hypothetical protein
MPHFKTSQYQVLYVAIFALCVLGFAQGAVVTSVETDIAPSGGTGAYTPIFPSGGPSSSDILNGLLPSASVGNFTRENSTGVAALTNGSVSTFYGNQTAESIHAAYATGGVNESVTYALSGIYNISSIVVYGGWNDAGRDQQHYNILTSSNAGSTFDFVGTIDINPGVQNTHVTPVSNRVAFSDDSLANLATGATHVRLEFLGVENGYTGYTEIDVFGAQQFMPGDANRDNIVNFDDFIVISNNFSKVPSAPGLDGDVFVDNIVDQRDFRLWKNVVEPAVAAQAEAYLAAPEPSLVAMLGLAWAGIACFLRRRS